MANEWMSGAQGFLGGAGLGASMGTTVAPGVGTVVGALLGGTIGAFSGASKAGKQNDAVARLMAIPEVDPNQTMFKDQLFREKRAVESGFTTDFQVAKDIIGKSEAGGMSVAAEMAQSNPALALMAMNQVGQGADTAVNKALGTIGTRGMGYTQMIQDLIDKMSQRKLSLDLYKGQVGITTATQGMQDFNANSNAGMMKLMDPSVIGGFKKFAGMFSGVGVGGGAVNNPVTMGNFDFNTSTLNPVT
jgi:hypothetical protein